MGKITIGVKINTFGKMRHPKPQLGLWLYNINTFFNQKSLFNLVNDNDVNGHCRNMLLANFLCLIYN